MLGSTYRSMWLDRKRGPGAKRSQEQSCRACKGLSPDTTLDPRHGAFFGPPGREQLIKGPGRLGTDCEMNWYCPGSLLSVYKMGQPKLG